MITPVLQGVHYRDVNLLYPQEYKGLGSSYTVMKYKVRLEKTEEGYAVWCLGLRGCCSQEASEKEALENIKDAIETYLVTIDELEKDKSTRLAEVQVRVQHLNESSGARHGLSAGPGIMG